MGVNPATFASGDHLDPLSGNIQGGDRQKEPEPGESAEVANFGFLEIPTVGLVIEKRLLSLAARIPP